MEDRQIVELYHNRSELAVEMTRQKYDSYCRKIAYNILSNNEDTEECVNDAYLAAWNSIPPHSPENLKTYLGKLTRNISIDRWRTLRSRKNGNGEIFIAFDELKDCASVLNSTEQIIENRELLDAYIRFLDTLPISHRRIFLLRYWYVEPIANIAEKFGFSEGKVKSILHRIRKKLQLHLKKEGF